MRKAKETLGRSYIPCIVFLCVALVTILTRTAIGIMESNDISLWVFGLSSDELMPALGAASGFCVVLFFSFYLSSKNAKHKAVIAVVSVLVNMLVCAEAAFTYSRQPEYEYFEIVSEDKEHEIIIKEGSFLLLGEGEFYEKTSPVTMVRLGGYSTDDGYSPFSDNKYEILWNENGFEVVYSFDGSDITKKETVEYAEHKKGM